MAYCSAVIDSVADQNTKPRARPTLDLMVLYGGPGSEREVSLQSGKAVYDALVRLGHRVALVDILPDRLHLLDDAARDLAFIVLHGEFGEDGTIQRELGLRQMRFTGCDAAASETAMDKAAAKEKFIRASVPTPHYQVVSPKVVEQIGAEFPVPAVVKPVRSGSSVDTFICRDRKTLVAHLKAVVLRYGDALVETYIDGPELTVGILGLEALPVCQIRTRREFYDYQAKYIDDDTEYLFDIDLPPALLQRVQELSVTAHRSLGCRDFSRVDWRIDGKTMEPFILEINTIPGFTSHSLLPKAAARIGISFDALCERIVELAMQRDRETRPC